MASKLGIVAFGAVMLYSESTEAKAWAAWLLLHPGLRSSQEHGDRDIPRPQCTSKTLYHSEHMRPLDDAAWQQYKDEELLDAPVESASDQSLHYISQIIGYAERWADLMEASIAAGESLPDCAERTSFEADNPGPNGITLFMYQMAVRMLCRHWIHGKELRLWHNARFKDPKDTTVDPEGSLLDCSSVNTPAGKVMLVAPYAELSAGIGVYHTARLEGAAEVFLECMDSHYTKYVRGTLAPQHLMCPNCQVRCDQTCLDDKRRTPKPGDTTVCVYCGCMMRFDKNLDYVLLSKEQLRDLREQNTESFLHLGTVWWAVVARLPSRMSEA